MKVLSVDQVVAGYGDAQILNGVSLELRGAEIVSIIGPNGAGKSTLLKAIVGLVEVRSGTIEFRGTDITRQRTELIIRSGIGYVPQVANVFPSLSVRENLELMFPRRAKASLVASAISGLLEMFPALAEKLRNRASTLSGGERQMLALARALVTSPRLLLLDEPTAAVAPILVDAIFAKIREINREHDIPIVLVEQNAKKALAVSDRGYVLEAGREALTGRAGELLANPNVERLYLGGSTQAADREVVAELGSDSMGPADSENVVREAHTSAPECMTAGRKQMNSTDRGAGRGGFSNMKVEEL
jgi:neutral amino acid transport system ATP-binding protein